MPPSAYGRPRNATGRSASDNAAPYSDDPEWLESAFRQGVNPQTWHLAEPAANELTATYRKTGFVPALNHHFVGPDNRVYLRSPETEPDQAARDRLGREARSALFGTGSQVETVTGIPDGGFKILKQAAQQTTDTIARTDSAPTSQTPAVDPDRSLARSKRFAREIVALEGGVANRPAAEDPGGLTRYGVTRETFNGWLPRHKLDGRLPVPASFEHVDADAAVRIIREVAYDDYKLDQIEDDRLAHQLMDIFAMTSPKDAYPIVQGAIDEVMRKHGLRDEENEPIHPTSPVRDRTRARMNWLVRNGVGTELKNALVEHRLAAARLQPHYKYNPGWVKRFRRFLEPIRDL